MLVMVEVASTQVAEHGLPPGRNSPGDIRCTWVAPLLHGENSLAGQSLPQANTSLPLSHALLWVGE